MKPYPSILFASSKTIGSYGHVFYKYDGSNLRWEWSPKRGWYKQGTRNHLFDQTDSIYGPAIPIFMEKLASPLESIFKQKYPKDNIIVFTEYFGPNSFAGQHDPATPKQLVLFDVNINKRGFVDPDQFIDIFSSVAMARLLYSGFITEEFIDQIENGQLFDLEEGVVCKGGTKHHRWCFKIKTNAYRDKLKQVFKQNWESHW